MSNWCICMHTETTQTQFLIIFSFLCWYSAVDSTHIPYHGLYYFARTHVPGNQRRNCTSNNGIICFYFFIPIISSLRIAFVSSRILPCFFTYIYTRLQLQGSDKHFKALPCTHNTLSCVTPTYLQQPEMTQYHLFLHTAVVVYAYCTSPHLCRLK